MLNGEMKENEDYVLDILVQMCKCLLPVLYCSKVSETWELYRLNLDKDI